MPLTAKEIARGLRKTDLLQYPAMELQGFLQALGQSARGTREELIERLYRAIWQDKYNDPNFD